MVTKLGGLDREINDQGKGLDPQMEDVTHDPNPSSVSDPPFEGGQQHDDDKGGNSDIPFPCSPQQSQQHEEPVSDLCYMIAKTGAHPAISQANHWRTKIVRLSNSSDDGTGAPNDEEARSKLLPNTLRP